MKKQELSLWKQTVAWVKDIPHKLEVLLNNLYTMSTSLSMIGVGVYSVLEVVPNLTGYVAVIGLIASVTIAVDGTFRLGRFLMGGK